MEQFTMKDQSSKPYGWVMEGATEEALRDFLGRGGTIEAFAVDYVQSTIASWYHEDARTDAEIYTEWSESGELQQLVSYIEGHLEY